MQSAYQLRPTLVLARVVPVGKAAPAWLAKGYKAAAGTASRQVDKMAWLKRLPGSDPQRLTVSLTESLCFRCVRPAAREGERLPSRYSALTTVSKTKEL